MSEKCPKCGATMLPAFQSAIQKMLGSVVTGIGGEIVCLETDGMDCLRRQLAQAQEELADWKLVFGPGLMGRLAQTPEDAKAMLKEMSDLAVSEAAAEQAKLTAAQAIIDTYHAEPSTQQVIIEKLAKFRFSFDPRDNKNGAYQDEIHELQDMARAAAEAPRKRNVQTIADATEAEWKEKGNG